MKILLAVDGSKYTKKMLAYLTTHETLCNPQNEYVMLTVQPTLPPHVRSTIGKEMVEKFQHEDAEKVLAPVSKFLLRHGIQAQGTWKVGQPGECIAKAADSGKFDMVVMGSHGHSAFANLVMGSVATQVLAHCSTPVLLVR
ncbi:MAG: universal stress protein [Betaproteobacteria bacterium]|jgi:nucleotide-binding universal stress UspA family protein|nr:universal stress protein [Betaproteobacteria bacterium]MBK7655792.1 universal stress protein [Betaproteobacteria bacterium]MBP6647850.1 universal stress protein [Burkholderiaceae bacterium]